MQISEHVYVMHIDDGGIAHPGGSNNFFVGDPNEEMTLIDTGEHRRDWTGMILDYYEELGRPRINNILITHGHQDHVGGADRVYDAMQAPVRCHPKLVEQLEKMVGEGTVQPLKSRELIRTGGGATLLSLFTPGHEIDHVCYYLKEDKIMFTGDTVLGASSSTVRDLSSYMKSLELLTTFEHDTVCPAHGPVVPPPRGKRLVQTYIDHRMERERQVLDALSEGIAEVPDIVRHIYPRNLKRGLRRSAERNVTTHLDKLAKEGRVTATAVQYNLNE